MNPGYAEAVDLHRSITPKVLSNFSPGLECSDNPGLHYSYLPTNPERVSLAANPFRVKCPFGCAYLHRSITPKVLANFSPGLERSDNPGLHYIYLPTNPERVSLAANPFRL